MKPSIRSARWLIVAIPATLLAAEFAWSASRSTGAQPAVDASDSLAVARPLRQGDASGVALANPTRVRRDPAAGRAPSDTTFAGLVAALSEPGGYFDSDNLISNETSYLHVLDAMRRIGVRGGAYIGVGPDQNFSYIAAVRPRVAFMMDIRRDNLLEHLLFKALFAMSRSRVEYMCLLFGKPVPANAERWKHRPIADLVAYIDRTRTDPDLVDSVQSAVSRRVRSYGVPLSPTDLETIARIRDAFVRDSLDLRYSSIGRAPRPYHPLYRQLLLERDRSGAQRNFLASDEAFQFVKDLEARDRVIPVVGNAAGDHALAAIGRYVAARDMVVSTLYMSNVEQYLIRDGGFLQFAANVKALPRDDHSVLIRSFFARGYGYGMNGAHPLNVPGHYSTQILQTLDAFTAVVDSGTITSYFDLVTRSYVAP